MDAALASSPSPSPSPSVFVPALPVPPVAVSHLAFQLQLQSLQNELRLFRHFRYPHLQPLGTDATIRSEASAAAATAAASTSTVVMKSSVPMVSIPPAVSSLSNSSVNIRVLLSRLLGVVVSLGSAFVKLPQILRIYRSNRSNGLSLSMYAMEVFTQTIAVLYHYTKKFPLNTYGENLTLGGGNILILLLCFRATGSLPPLLFALLPFPLSFVLLRFPLALSFLQSLSIPLNIAAKLPQILANFHSPGGDTGELSALPFIGNMCGSLARLYTTVQELDGDPVVIAGFVSSVLLNGIIIGQVIVSNWRRRKREEDAMKMSGSQNRKTAQAANKAAQIARKRLSSKKSLVDLTQEDREAEDASW